MLIFDLLIKNKLNFKEAAGVILFTVVIILMMGALTYLLGSLLKIERPALLAILITIRYFRAGVPFNLGWWGYTFPLGVYTVATLKLGTQLDIAAFAIFGTMLVIVLAAMWVLVAALTIHGGWKGHLFVSPCIATVN